MSIQMKPEIMIRIRAASPDSPIAIFSCKEPMHYRAVFAACIQSIREMRDDKSFIGAFHRDNKGDAMRAML